MSGNARNEEWLQIQMEDRGSFPVRLLQCSLVPNRPWTDDSNGSWPKRWGPLLYIIAPHLIYFITDCLSLQAKSACVLCAKSLHSYPTL